MGTNYVCFIVLNLLHRLQYSKIKTPWYLWLLSQQLCTMINQCNFLYVLLQHELKCSFETILEFFLVTRWECLGSSIPLQPYPSWMSTADLSLLQKPSRFTSKFGTFNFILKLILTFINSNAACHRLGNI